MRDPMKFSQLREMLEKHHAGCSQHATVAKARNAFRFSREVRKVQPRT
jgi:hypothetical protein